MGQPTGLNICYGIVANPESSKFVRICTVTLYTGYTKAVCLCVFSTLTP